MLVQINLFKTTGKWAYGGIVDIGVLTLNDTDRYERLCKATEDFVTPDTAQQHIMVVTNLQPYDADRFFQCVFFPNDIKPNCCVIMGGCAMTQDTPFSTDHRTIAVVAASMDLTSSQKTWFRDHMIKEDKILEDHEFMLRVQLVRKMAEKVQ